MHARVLKERLARRLADEKAQWSDRVANGGAADFPGYREMVGRIKSIDWAMSALDDEMKQVNTGED